MKITSKPGRKWLIAAGRAVARELKERCGDTRIRTRMPSRAAVVDTDGWRVVIGSLGRTRPELHLWLDRFPGYDARKLYAGYVSDNGKQIVALSRRASRALPPHRIISSQHLNLTGHVHLRDRLRRKEFNVPLLEQYEEGNAFYGIYEPTRQSALKVSNDFLARAAAFFESVARTLPHATSEGDEREIYPKVEDRKLVAAHLRRERSRYLATERKVLDNYECQVCGIRMQDIYGAIGIGLSEAHHLKPLGRQRGSVTTTIEDLRTVCPNCHRALHRMDGKSTDFRRLKAVVKRCKLRRSR
jgi:5-methylcytosine-specific restriction endonuclease McrA